MQIAASPLTVPSLHRDHQGCLLELSLELPSEEVRVDLGLQIVALQSQVFANHCSQALRAVGGQQVPQYCR